MEDPTSDLAEDIPPEEATRCEVCDEPLVDAPDRTAVTWVEDGEAVTVDFCDDACRREWDAGAE